MSVSVIMTCHNEEAYIEQAVRSVTAQTAWSEVTEIIVVNDGSTDGSGLVLKRLAHDIDRLQIIRTEGIGVPAARNHAIRVARAPLIAFLDGDDYWAPDKLERQLGAFAGDARIGLVYSDYIDFTKDDASDAQLVNVRCFDARTPDTLAEYFVHDGPIVPSTAIITRSVFDDVGLFDEAIRIGEDTELFLRIAERWQFQYVPGGLTSKRRHGRNITRHLDALLPLNVRLTTQFVERNPRLKTLARQRLARRYARVGHDCGQHGQFVSAIGHLGRALMYSPAFWRAYAYLALMFLPHRVRPAMLRTGKRLFHGSLHRLRAAVMAR